MQIGDKCLNLCDQIKGVDRSRLHWQRGVLRQAAVARFELRNLRLAARAPGADDGLTALADRLEAELDQALENHKGRL